MLPYTTKTNFYSLKGYKNILYSMNIFWLIYWFSHKTLLVVIPMQSDQYKLLEQFQLLRREIDQWKLHTLTSMTNKI